MEDFIVVETPDQTVHNLDEFHELSERKVPWDERIQVIKKRFPAIDRLNWDAAFKADPTLFGRVINDILKVDAAEPGKPGKRPAIDPKDAEQRLNRLMGEDYTSLSFTDAFNLMVGNRSIRAIAAKTNLNRNVIFDLKQGGRPSVNTMEKVAKAFGKKPSFFCEYRLTYITAVLYQRLDSNPESTINLYRKVRFAEGSY